MQRLFLFATFVIFASFAAAQAPVPGAAPGRGGRGGAPQKPSYEVRPDRTVTFELRAPDATTVRISGDFGPAQDMKKGEDGVWTATVGPLNPAIYSYTFNVNGVSVTDPINPMIKAGDRTSQSMFEVPAEKPAPYEIQSGVPHGTVHVNLYESKTLKAPRMMYVYTPPGYESSSAKYPVLYLLHGSGDTEAGWVTIGRANLILDNLIAAGKAKPMMVVMPYGRATAGVTLKQVRGGQGQANPTAFQDDVLNDVIPYVEKMYRVSAKADDRALAGLSMGGGQTLQIGMSHLDTFHYLGAFSAAARGNPEEAYKEFFADPAAANKKLKLFYIACGKTDSLFAGSQNLSNALTKANIKHTFVASEEGHVWRNWRNYLADLTPQLFR